MNIELERGTSADGDYFDRGEWVILVDGVRWGRTHIEHHGMHGTSTTIQQEAGDVIEGVCQFFADETCEYVRRGVGAREAVETAKAYTESVGAQIGTTVRVIITDGGDFTAFEWKRGEGVTFPPREGSAS